MKLEIEVLARVGDEVLVQNYRTKDKLWELGSVSDVEIKVDNGWGTRVGYTVTLHRRVYSKNATPMGNRISLYVNQDKIRLNEKLPIGKPD